MATVDPESISWARVVIAFAIVFGLLAGLAFVLKHVTARGIRWPAIKGGTQRLRVVESLALDVRRRLVIVRCDNEEHLLLLGLNQDIVIAAGLAKNQVGLTSTTSGA